LAFSFFFSLFLVDGDAGAVIAVAVVAIVALVATVATVSAVSSVASVGTVASVATAASSPLSFESEWASDSVASEDGGHFRDGGGGDEASAVPVSAPDWDSSNSSSSIWHLY
jgi:hypothetical protein